MKDVKQAASNLYDGGWRSSDRDQLISEYDLTESEADEICDALSDIEETCDDLSDKEA